MLNLKQKSKQGIEDITEVIKRTQEKYNELELDRDLSVVVSTETYPYELNSNKKEATNNNNNDNIYKSSFEKDSLSLKNLKFENNVNISKEGEREGEEDYNISHANFNQNTIRKKKINSPAENIVNIKDTYINLNNGRIDNIGMKNQKGNKDSEWMSHRDKDVLPLIDKRNNACSDINNFNNNLSLELNESTQNLIKQNNLNFNNNDYNLILNKMNNNEKHVRNNSESLHDNKVKLQKINNVRIPNSINNNSLHNNILANSNFNSSVDRIYSSLEDFQKNIEKDFTEIEEMIDNLVEKDLKSLK